VVAIDYEIANVNISLPAKIKEGSSTDGTIVDEVPVAGWHKDSYPFVCVLMMSDTAGMIGGETALRTGSGEIKLVRGPCKVRYSYSKYISHSDLSRALLLSCKAATSSIKLYELMALKNVSHQLPVSDLKIP